MPNFESEKISPASNSNNRYGWFSSSAVEVPYTAVAAVFQGVEKAGEQIDKLKNFNKSSSNNEASDRVLAFKAAASEIIQNPHGVKSVDVDEVKNQESNVGNDEYKVNSL
jgi:hypothetical protein